MEIEITIRVPVAAPAAAAPQPVVEAEASLDEVVHEPPSPAAFGLVTTVPSVGAAPPSIEMMERLAAEPARTNGPPGLEGLSLAQAPAGNAGTGGVPPGLPDPSEMPPVDEAPRKAPRRRRKPPGQ